MLNNSKTNFMKAILSQATAVLVLFSTFFYVGIADTITEPAEADSFVMDGSYENVNFGSNAQLSSGNTSGFNAITYLKFPVNLPAGFSIESATLRLYSLPSTEGSFKVQRAAGSWSEDSITWKNQPGIINSPDYFIGLDTLDTWAEWNVKSIIEEWHVNNEANHGFIVWSGNIGTGGYFNFVSSEGAIASRRPQLVIVGSERQGEANVVASFDDQTFNLELGDSLTRVGEDAWEVINDGDIGSSASYSFMKTAPDGNPNPSWLTITPSSGTLTREANELKHNYISITADSAGFPKGEYKAVVTLSSNAANFPDVQRTVTMVVAPEPGPDWEVIDYDPLDLGPYEPGQLVPFSVTIKNSGTSPAPKSLMQMDSRDYYTNLDSRIQKYDVPALDVGGTYTSTVYAWVGANTTHLSAIVSVNANSLPELDSDNNISDWFLTARNSLPSRLQGNTEQKNGFSGDPVNTATGNFVHHSTDLVISSRISDFRFTRYYNSQSGEISSLGRGWRHSFMYSMDLSNPSKPGVIFPDGRSEYWNEEAGSYVPLFTQIFNRLEKVGSNWQVRLKDLRIINFDSTGRCTSYSDKNGNMVNLAYSGSNLISVTDPAGRVLSLTYSNSRLIRVQDWTGRDVEFGYTGDNLSLVTDTKNQQIGIRYDAGNRLDRITDQRGVNVLNLVYDELGRVIRQTDGLGNLTSFAYDTPVAFSTTVTNAEGDATVHVHNDAFQLLEVVDELGRKVSYTYDQASGLRNSITDKAGNPPTTFLYDDRGNLLQTTFPDLTTESFTYNADDLPLTKTDQIGLTTAWTYDENGNVVTETDAFGNIRRWTYNGFGQKLTETDRTGAVTSYTYDEVGLLTSVEDADGVGETYGYDSLWRRTTITDKLGNVTTTVYNVDDTIAQVQLPIGMVVHTYDQIGNRLSEQDANGNTTAFEYDNNSNRTKLVLPNELGTTTYAYDSLNRLSSTIDGRGKVWTRTYYDDSRLQKEIDPLGNEIVYTYDSNGNILTETDGSGRTMTYTYDAMNRRLSAKDGVSNTTSYGYDDRGLRTSVTDPLGFETVYTYDDLRRLVTVRVKASNSINDAVTLYVYDNEGRLRTVTDAEGSVWENQYTLAGRRSSRIDGLSRLTSFSYDAAGNLEKVGYPTGDTETYTYDQNNRRVGLAYNDGRSANYTLDANGNTTQLSDWAGTTFYVYDEVNRVTSITDPFGKTIQYGYDLAGNRTKITYPTVGAVTYDFDDRNGLSRVTDWKSNQVNYTRDGAFRLLARTFPNGVEAEYSYDNAGRLTSLFYKKGANMLLSYGLTLDGNSNPTSLSTAGLPTINALYPKNLSYIHDAAHQMASSSESDYSYDQRGALSHREQPGELESSFNFSADGMLQSYSSLEGTSVENLFDANRMRIRATRDGAETRLVLDRQRSMANVIAETSASGSATRYFLHGEQTLAMYDTAGNATRYYLTDPFGNVIALTDSSGAVTDTYRYDPFGNVIGQLGSTENPFTFVGAYGVMAEPGGLYFMRARYYYPEQGRFISVDPVEGEVRNPASMHRYLYAINNSLVYTDPNGDVPVPLITGAIGAGVGAIWGGGSQIALDVFTGNEIDGAAVWGGITSGALQGAYVGSGAALVGGVLGAAGAGAVSGFAGNSVEQLIRKDGYSVEEALAAGAIGGITGGTVSAITGGFTGTKFLTSTGRIFNGAPGRKTSNIISQRGVNELFKTGVEEVATLTGEIVGTNLRSWGGNSSLSIQTEATVSPPRSHSPNLRVETFQRVTAQESITKR